MSQLRGVLLYALALAPLCAAGTGHAEDTLPEPPPAAAAPGENTVSPAELAEAYFDEAERFDAFLTYEARRGPARALFNVARRWRDGRAELLFDIREPAAFSKWALLMRQSRSGSDDLFAYIPDGGTGFGVSRRVRRLSATHLANEAFFALVALADYRPVARGELAYEAAPDETVAGTPCRVVVGRPSHRALGFERVELAFATETRLLVESRFFRRGREFRRLSVAPGEHHDYDGRRIPRLRIAKGWADDGQTEIELISVLATPELPDGLFSHLNLRVQHFPEF